MSRLYLRSSTVTSGSYAARMAPQVDAEDLVGAVEVAEILGLSHPSSVSTYARRYSDFPQAVVVLPKSKVRLWLRQEILGFKVAHSRRRDA